MLLPKGCYNIRLLDKGLNVPMEDLVKKGELAGNFLIFHTVFSKTGT